jgi:hypothetical protein
MVPDPMGLECWRGDKVEIVSPDTSVTRRRTTLLDLAPPLLASAFRPAFLGRSGSRR